MAQVFRQSSRPRPLGYGETSPQFAHLRIASGGGAAAAEQAEDLVGPETVGRPHSRHPLGWTNGTTEPDSPPPRGAATQGCQTARFTMRPPRVREQDDRRDAQLAGIIARLRPAPSANRGGA